MSSHISAAVAQSVERRLGKAEVTGSIPVSSSFFMPILLVFWTLKIQEQAHRLSERKLIVYEPFFTFIFQTTLYFAIQAVLY